MRLLSKIVIAVTTVFLVKRDADGYLNYTEELGCHDTEFRLSCKSLTGNIAIFEAYFRPKSCENSNRSISNSCNSSKDCSSRISSWKVSENLQVNFRHAINRRCSGVNYCSFQFEKDFEGARKIGPGEIFLRYACVEESEVIKNCNSKVNASQESLAKSPGYPGYYMGGSSCRWNLKAPSSQRVKLSLLDISLRGIGPHESNCTDWIIVSENGLNLLAGCGDISGENVIRSHGSSLNVSLISHSKTIFPKRGLLFHFKAVGCPPARVPEDGYLIEKNDTFVRYRCSLGFVFPDTLTRNKIIRCHNENSWNEDVLDCVSIAKLARGEKNFYSNDSAKENLTYQAIAEMELTDPVKDIILPSIIMLALFVGNGIVLYVIYRQRKKLAENDKLIELHSIPKKITEEGNC